MRAVHLHVFGTNVFVYLPKEKRVKWVSKDKQGIVIMYK